jgi:hypothetical protein
MVSARLVPKISRQSTKEGMVFLVEAHPVPCKQPNPFIKRRLTVLFKSLTEQTSTCTARHISKSGCKKNKYFIMILA